jgi:excisionase family DNA binding protein
MEEDILTKSELAEILKVTEKTIDRLRTKGMPSFKVGTKVRFKKAKVIEWLENQGKDTEK